MMSTLGSRLREASPFSLSKWFSLFSELETELLLLAFRTEYQIATPTCGSVSKTGDQKARAL
jgi:hypothetical protein